MEEEITHDYVQPESAEEHSLPQLALQPAPPSKGEGRPNISRGRRDKQESLPRSKKATSYTYTYGSGSSRSSCKSHQVELTPLQAAMIEERRKLGELQEIQSQIQEGCPRWPGSRTGQASTSSFNRSREVGQASTSSFDRAREDVPISDSTATTVESSTRIGQDSANNLIHRRHDHRTFTFSAT